MTYRLTLLTGKNPNEPIDFQSAVGTSRLPPTLNQRFVLVVQPHPDGTSNFITTNFVTQVTDLGGGSYSFADATPATYHLEKL